MHIRSQGQSRSAEIRQRRVSSPHGRLPLNYGSRYDLKCATGGGSTPFASWHRNQSKPFMPVAEQRIDECRRGSWGRAWQWLWRRAKATRWAKQVPHRASDSVSDGCHCTPSLSSSCTFCFDSSPAGPPGSPICIEAGRDPLGGEGAHLHDRQCTGHCPATTADVVQALASWRADSSEAVLAYYLLPGWHGQPAALIRVSATLGRKRHIESLRPVILKVLCTNTSTLPPGGIQNLALHEQVHPEIFARQ